MTSVLKLIAIIFTTLAIPPDNVPEDKDIKGETTQPYIDYIHQRYGCEITKDSINAIEKRIKKRRLRNEYH